MEAQLLQIREQQKEIWNRFSPGWKKWDELTMNFLKPMGEEIIRHIKPKDTDMVLDVASGTGEPGLTIATKLKGGMVVMIDVSDDMLGVARENAKKRGINNIKILSGDVSELPFSDNSFDSISCRFGFMFFPDMLLAAKEMARVLKPGGKISTAVWNIPEKNFWATAILDIIDKKIKLVTPPPEAPGLFRCAKKGLIAGLFKKAGFRNISEKEIGGKLNAGNTETYWNFMTEVGAPVVAALSNVDNAMRLKIRSEVIDSISKKYNYGKVAIESSALVISAEK